MQDPIQTAAAGKRGSTMLQDNQQTATPVGKSQKTNWVLFIAFSALFLIFAFFWGYGNIFLWLRGLNAVGPWNESFLIPIVSVIRPIAIICAFVFINRQKKTPAIVCAAMNTGMSLLMTFGIMMGSMTSPMLELPALAWIPYCLDLLASLLLLVFTLGKMQKYSKFFFSVILLFGVLSVLISFLLSMFRYPDGRFAGSIFWEQGGIQEVFFSNYRTLCMMNGCATIFWPIGQCFYFFALFSGMRNGCAYPVKALKTVPQVYGGAGGTKEKNKVAYIFKVIAVVVFILGGIGALFCFTRDNEGMIWIGLYILLGAFFGGILDYAIGEGLQLLSDIKHNTAQAVFQKTLALKNLQKIHVNFPKE